MFFVIWVLDKACCPVFVFRRGISNAICDIVLYLLIEGWNIPLINHGTVPFQYLKTVVAMQDSALSKSGSQFICLKRVLPMW